MNVFSTLAAPTHDGPTRALLAVSGAPSATDPALVGIAFAPDGDLLASDSMFWIAANTNIVRYSGTTGALVDTLVAPGSGGLNTPPFSTVSDIPEPGTLALLGLGLAAMLARRRIICNRDDRYGCNPRRRRVERPLAG